MTTSPRMLRRRAAALVATVAAVVALAGAVPAGAAGPTPPTGPDGRKAPAAPAPVAPDGDAHGAPTHEDEGAPGGAAGDDGWVHLGGDVVVAPPPTAADAGAPPPEATVGDGFTTFTGVDGNIGSYTFRLVSSSGIESVRPYVQAVSTQLTSITGATFVVAPGTTSDQTQRHAEILIVVSSTSPCGASGWAGCAGPRYAETFDDPDSGMVWIHPSVLTYSATSFQHVVAHEMGHALGLQHETRTHNGAVQVMHPTSYDGGASFRSGDANGLRYLHAGRPFPANDPAGSPAGLSSAGVGLVAEGSNVNATAQSGETTGLGTARRTIWYRWVADRTGTVVATTVGSSFDATLDVYEGSWPSATRSGFDDDSAGDLQARVEVDVVAGRTYLFQVGSATSTTFGWAVVGLDVPLPGNDDRADATTIAGTGATVVGTTGGATRETDEPLHADVGYPSVWYRFTPAHAGRWVLSTAGSSFDTVLAVYPNAGGWPAALGSDDDAGPGDLTSRVEVVLPPGQSVLVAVSGFSGATGDVRLDVRLGPWTPFATAEELQGWSYAATRGRAPDAGLAASRTDDLTSGRVRPDDLVVSDLTSSTFAARTGRIARLYSAYFLRPPETDGFRFWLAQAETWSLSRISSSFAGSPEFRNRYGALDDAAFVDRVYRNVLGRGPDAEGRAFWTGRLRSGLSRGGMMIGFSESAEYVRQMSDRVFVLGAHWAFLDELPRSSVLAEWTALLAGGAPRTAAVVALRRDPRFVARVT